MRSGCCADRTRRSSRLPEWINRLSASTVIISSLSSFFNASSTPKIAGIPNSLDTVARWPATLPVSPIKAVALLNSGAHSGSGCSTTSMAPLGNWSMSSEERTVKTGPQATPELAVTEPRSRADDTSDSGVTRDVSRSRTATAATMGLLCKIIILFCLLIDHSIS